MDPLGKIPQSFELARKVVFQYQRGSSYSHPSGADGESWENAQTGHRLNPEHVSAYSLIIEEGTPGAEKMRKNDAEEERFPSEEEERAMYELTDSVLKENGYLHYEISNLLLKPGMCMRHNLGYWQRKITQGIWRGFPLSKSGAL